MIDKVIEIELLPADRVVTRPVHQWDIGQIIKVTGLDIEDGTPVDIGNRFMKGGLRAYLIGNQVTIPAPALQQERDLTAYVVITDENSETTVKEIFIPVIPRPKPEDYVDEEIRESTEFQYVLQAVGEVGADAKAAAESAKNAADSETAAGNAATEAEKAASAAAGSATSADASAKAAATSEQTASGAATTATDKANEAADSEAAAKAAQQAAEAARDEALSGGKADEKVAEHNVAADSHNDIRLLISNLTTRLNTLANSTDTDLDQMAELVAYIKDNRELIEQITTGKVSVTDIINNLTTNVSDKPLSAAQGVVLKGLIDALQTAVNAAAKATDLTSHTGNTTVHITAAERTKWNQAVTDVGTLSEEIVDLSEDVAKLKTESEAKIGKNKLNLDALTEGYYLWADGSLEAYSGRWTTDYIAVSEGNIVTLSYTEDGVITPYTYNSICLYDADKNVVSGGDYNKYTFTVPTGVAYVRLTISSVMVMESYYPQIELTTDGVPTSYAPYGVVAEEEETGATSKIFTAIPPVINITVGNEFKMYYKNVLSCFTDRLWLGYTSGITVKRYADYLSITASEAGTLNISWKVYDESFNVLDSGTMQVIATADTAKTTTALVIGDSTVTQSNAISQKLLDCYSASNGTLTLLGTKGTSPALHEGRAGWTTTKYCTVADDNPFYNNVFDFSYYMTQQGYNGVDVVVIQLGINDIFTMTHENFSATTTLDNLTTMINSILTYDSNIKVIIDLISPPNANGTSFTNTYNTTQIDFVYLVNTIRLSKALIEHFSSNTSVTISPNNCVIDATTDINDGVHPNTTGYAKLGQAIYETINGIVVGSEVASYTNILPSAIDSSGAVYNGTGWKDSMRINSSGVESTSTYTGTSLTGFIPAKTGDVFEFKDFKILTNGASSSGVRLGLYDSSKAFIAGVPYANLATGALNAVVDSDGCVTELTMTEAFLTTDITGVAFVRFMTYDEFATADSIITRNEPITD